MRKLLGIASVLLLVGAGCGIGQQTELQVQTPPAAQPATPPSEGIQAEIDANLSLKASVSITANGTFSPAVITVKQGTTVTWTNTGSARVWIASGPHPTHSGYPGFDSDAAISAGGSYSFTFDKKGSWRYHDHLNESVQGTVIVE